VKNDQAEIMVLASFIGDALTLGAHWIYDTEKIQKLFGRVDTYVKPLNGSYHTVKNAGDLLRNKKSWEARGLKRIADRFWRRSIVLLSLGAILWGYKR